MNTDQPYLFIDVDDKNIIFSVIKYDEKMNYKIINSLRVDSAGVVNGKIFDIEKSTQIIKNCLNEIEEKVNHLFTNAIIIINPNKINCINVCGYKKLNGSQVSKEDVTYILNDSKKLIALNEDKSSLVHLFNSSFSIDSDNLENLPLGLFGEFYNQNMTFLLMDKNTLKNIKSLLKNCGINSERIVLKHFVEGINLLQNKNIDKNFTTIRISHERSSLAVFKNKSYVYSEEFNFGLNLLINDVSKLCSLKLDEAKTILSELNFDEDITLNENNILDKKYFINSPYRKIKLKLVYDIIGARLDELFEIFYKKNTNLIYFKKTNKNIYFYIDSLEMLKNIKFILKKKQTSDLQIIFNEPYGEKLISASLGAAELIGKGWEKEAIPITQSKKSIFARLFSTIFN